MLNRIVDKKNIRINDILTKSKNQTGLFVDAMNKSELSIIGEIKKASPSKGVISEEFPFEEITLTYNQSVDAMSVLTEEDFFKGNKDIFRTVRENTNLPILRKDFIIHPIQIIESKELGANCILLIAAILDDNKLKLFYDIAKFIGLDCLIEVHDNCELERVLRLNPDLIGINNRDLKTFQVDINNTFKLAPLIPSKCTIISESGFHKPEDTKGLKELGVKGILVGESFMRSKHIKLLAEGFKNEYNN